MLADDVSPSRLVTARESDEASPTREMVEDGGLFGDANRILGAHHVTQLADSDMLRDSGPIGVEDAGVGSAFVTFGPEVMLYRGDAPKTQFVGNFDYFVPSAQCFLIAIAIASERPKRRAFLFVGGGNHRVELKNDFEHEDSFGIADVPWRKTRFAVPQLASRVAARQEAGVCAHLDRAGASQSSDARRHQWPAYLIGTFVRRVRQQVEKYTEMRAAGRRRRQRQLHLDFALGDVGIKMDRPLGLDLEIATVRFDIMHRHNTALQ